MVKLTKIYTKTGDKGETGLAGGTRIKKTSLLIRSIGSIDELNAQLGYASSLLPQQDTFKEIYQYCQTLQNNLFNLGADLSTPTIDQRENTPRIKPEDITYLETQMDQMNSKLPTLTSFILPGGHPSAAAFHITRTVCRRAECDYWRWLETAQDTASLNAMFLNRLSDWLFICTRWINQQLNIKEPLWTQ